MSSTVIVFTGGEKIEVAGDVNTAASFLDETRGGKLMGFRHADPSLPMADKDKIVFINPTNVIYAYEKRESGRAVHYP